jgi:putative tricarboxylic transport membrane protein
MFELLLEGFSVTFSARIFPLLVAAVAGGIFIGSLPGLTATMGVAVLLPFTFGMESTAALVMLVGIYIGAIYGGSISAILLRTPGTPAAAATVLDGHELVLQGKAAKALSVSVISSFTGGIISTLMLITLSPVLARFALRFSAPEYFGLAVFGLTIIAGVSARNMVKGLLAGLFGLLIATIGLDPVTSYPRFTFGTIALLQGFGIIPVLIGLFAVSEALTQMESIFVAAAHHAKITIDRRALSVKEFFRIMPTAIKSGILGTFIGTIPGAGADIAAFVAYNEARRSARDPGKFGTGLLEGIAAPEAGNNGVTGGALVPLLTLGVPGDAVAAILLGALIIQGLTPGPLLFEHSAHIVYGLFASMLVANFVMLILGFFGIRLFSRIVEIPRTLIVCIIVLLSMVGAFSMNNSVFDVYLAIAFGVVGYLMRKVEIPLSPIVLAIILGPMAERNLRTAVQMYQGSWSFLYTRPITIAFLLLSVISMISASRIKKRSSVDLSGE